jgi:hypothetical protein
MRNMHKRGHRHPNDLMSKSLEALMIIMQHLIMDSENCRLTCKHMLKIAAISRGALDRELVATLNESKQWVCQTLKQSQMFYALVRRPACPDEPTAISIARSAVPISLDMMAADPCLVRVERHRLTSRALNRVLKAACILGNLALVKFVLEDSTCNTTTLDVTGALKHATAECIPTLLHNGAATSSPEVIALLAQVIVEKVDILNVPNHEMPPNMCSTFDLTRMLQNIEFKDGMQEGLMRIGFALAPTLIDLEDMAVPSLVKAAVTRGCTHRCLSVPQWVHGALSLGMLGEVGHPERICILQGDSGVYKRLTQQCIDNRSNEELVSWIKNPIVARYIQRGKFNCFDPIQGRALLTHGLKCKRSAEMHTLMLDSIISETNTDLLRDWALDLPAILMDISTTTVSIATQMLDVLGPHLVDSAVDFVTRVLAASAHVRKVCAGCIYLPFDLRLQLAYGTDLFHPMASSVRSDTNLTVMLKLSAIRETVWTQVVCFIYGNINSFNARVQRDPIEISLRGVGHAIDMAQTNNMDHITELGMTYGRHSGYTVEAIVELESQLQPLLTKAATAVQYGFEMGFGSTFLTQHDNVTLMLESPQVLAYFRNMPSAWFSPIWVRAVSERNYQALTLLRSLGAAPPLALIPSLLTAPCASLSAAHQGVAQVPLSLVQLEVLIQSVQGAHACSNELVPCHSFTASHVEQWLHDDTWMNHHIDLAKVGEVGELDRICILCMNDTVYDRMTAFCIAHRTTADLRDWLSNPVVARFISKNAFEWRDLDRGRLLLAHRINCIDPMSLYDEIIQCLDGLHGQVELLTEWGSQLPLILLGMRKEHIHAQPHNGILDSRPLTLIRLLETTLDDAFVSLMLGAIPEMRTICDVFLVDPVHRLMMAYGTGSDSFYYEIQSLLQEGYDLIAIMDESRIRNVVWAQVLCLLHGDLYSFIARVIRDPLDISVRGIAEITIAASHWESPINVPVKLGTAFGQQIGWTIATLSEFFWQIRENVDMTRDTVHMQAVVDSMIRAFNDAFFAQSSNVALVLSHPDVLTLYFPYLSKTNHDILMTTARDSTDCRIVHYWNTGDY